MAQLCRTFKSNIYCFVLIDFIEYFFSYIFLLFIFIIKFISLLKSHVDIHNRIYIYTYKHIKYINPFFTELQETKDKIHYTVTKKFFKQDLIYMVQEVHN